MKYDIARIQTAVHEAIEHGRGFATEDDGGTCNLDACIIMVPGILESDAAKIIGASLFKNHSIFGRHLHLGGTSGQGFRRTKMAEAQRDFLKANYPDLRIGMYYQMD